MVRKFPVWLKKGAKVTIKSAIFGLVNATIIDVTDASISYQPDRGRDDLSCSIGYMSTIMMINEGSICPL